MTIVLRALLVPLTGLVFGGIVAGVALGAGTPTPTPSPTATETCNGSVQTRSACGFQQQTDPQADGIFTWIIPEPENNGACDPNLATFTSTVGLTSGSATLMLELRDVLPAWTLPANAIVKGVVVRRWCSRSDPGRAVRSAVDTLVFADGRATANKSTSFECATGSPAMERLGRYDDAWGAIRGSDFDAEFGVATQYSGTGTGTATARVHRLEVDVCYQVPTPTETATETSTQTQTDTPTATTTATPTDTPTPSLPLAVGDSNITLGQTKVDSPSLYGEATQ